MSSRTVAEIENELKVLIRMRYQSRRFMGVTCGAHVREAILLLRKFRKALKQSNGGI